MRGGGQRIRAFDVQEATLRTLDEAAVRPLFTRAVEAAHDKLQALESRMVGHVRG